ncbi:hypothetical protein FRC11_008430 [Ceratobasidium sp. 423]|nr:hypothetical protein FRC11_008430 [Ceratobasidium sp. 423]
MGPRLTTSRTRLAPSKQKQHDLGKDAHVNVLQDGGFEMSFIPSGKPDEPKRKTSKPAGGKKVERFGAGMERGGGREEDSGENERNGRTRRRTGVRSGSKNAFRRG